MRRNFIIIILLLLLAEALLMLFFEHRERVAAERSIENGTPVVSVSPYSIDSLIFLADSLTFENEKLQVEFETLSETGYYLVVNTMECKFQLRKGQMVVREGPCGVGKGYTESGNRSWNFQTPPGERHIASKMENPTWHRPDWYWQEQGKKVPKSFITFSPKMPESERQQAYKIMSRSEKEYVRAVPGELGRYSLGIGDGYYIHYGKGLGSAVSHGCVRVGADDLEAIYTVLQIGDPVFIY